MKWHCIKKCLSVGSGSIRHREAFLNYPIFVSGVDVFQISSQVWTIVSSSCSKQDVMMPYSTQTSVQVELEYFRCSLAILHSHGSVV